jgi:hypothetical protein
MVAFLLWRPDVGGIFQKEKCYLWICRKTKISMLITTESFRARELSLKDSDKLWNIFLNACHKKTQLIINQHLLCHDTKLDTYGLNLSQYLHKKKAKDSDKVINISEKDLFSPIGLFGYPYRESINNFLKRNDKRQIEKDRTSYVLGLESLETKELFGLMGFTKKIYKISKFYRSGYFVTLIDPTMQSKGIASECRAISIDLLFKYFLKDCSEYVYLFSSFHPLNYESMKLQEKFNGANIFPDFAKQNRIDYYFEKENVYKSKGMLTTKDFSAIIDKDIIFKRMSNECIISK